MRQTPRILELDGIRGIAIAIVLFYHYVFLISKPTPATLISYVLSPARIGWSGVDLFFVLSGFLIGGILLDARDSSNFYKVFYVRRCFRIVPAYLSLLLVYMIFATIPGSVGKAVANNSLPLAPYFLFLQNFWMGTHFDLAGTTLGITWSLAIEEQFYLSLPLIIRNVPPRLLPRVLIGGVACAMLFRTALVFTLPPGSAYVWCLMPCRADALLLGVLAAWGFRNPAYRQWLQDHARLLRAMLLLLGFGMIALIRLLPRTGYQLMSLGGYSWIAAFFVCVLVYGLLFPQSTLSKALRLKWLRGLGTLAYGVYLFHALLLSLFFATFRSTSPQLTSFSDVLIVLGALACTITLCLISWRYFEKPLVRFGHGWNYSFEPAPIPRPDSEAATSC